MNITLKNKDKITLKTAGKICNEDIIVTPNLETKNETINNNGEYVFQAGDNFCGMKELAVAINIPVHDEYPNCEEVIF